MSRKLGATLGVSFCLDSDIDAVVNITTGQRVEDWEFDQEPDDEDDEDL